MKTESAIQTQQRNVEQDALFPNAQNTDEKPTVTTDDIVIRGEDESTYAPTFESALEDSQEAIVQRSFAAHKWEFAQNIDFRVKNDILVQLFQQEADAPFDGAINIARVGSLVKKLMVEERDRNFQAHFQLDSDTIPSAMLRELPPENGKSTYWVKDLDALEARAEVHKLMEAYISDLIPTTADTEYEMGDALASRLKEVAQAEAVAILKDQKRQLEQELREANKKIATLEVSIEKITGDVQERDLELLDRELIDHLTQEAQELAR